jgi:hypothetical protein
MAHPAGARGNQRGPADVVVRSGHPYTASQAKAIVEAQQLSEEEKRVLDCLQSADGGLTLSQLHSSTSCSLDDLRAAVDGLLDRYLVCELNTIVPSYACRYPGIKLYSD